MAMSAGEPDGRRLLDDANSTRRTTAHLPDQRAVTAPQAWQTKAREVLAMERH